MKALLSRMRAAPARRQTFLWFALMLTALRLWTLSGMAIWAQPFAPHDDAMMVHIAHTIGGGGPAYDELTLVKGWAFPALLAALHKLGIPYILFMALANAAVSLMAALAFSDGGMRPMHYALFAALLFNPAMSSQEIMMRVYRNGLSALTAFAVIVSLIAVYRRRYARKRTWLVWIAIASAALPVFWNTREDSIWLAPFIAGVALATAASALTGGRWRRACALLAAMLLPVASLGAAQKAIGLHMERQYGLPVVNELSQGEFPRVMRAIYALDTGEPDPICVAATRAKIRLLYAHSPSLAQIEPQLEAALDEWLQYVRYEENIAAGEVENGWFFWVLREAAAKAGKFESLAVSQAYWKAVADELDVAYASGALASRPTMPSALMPPWVDGTGERLTAALMRIPGFVTGFEDIARPLALSSGRQGRWVNPFEEITGNIAICSPEESLYGAALRAVDVQNALTGVYARIWPAVSWLARLSAIALLALVIARRGGQRPLYETAWALAGIAGALLTLYGGVAYNHAESCNSIHPLYLSAAYSPAILFDVLAIAALWREIGAWLGARRAEARKNQEFTGKNQKGN